MAKINYGPPATNPTDRPGVMRRDALGPGMMIGMTQRTAELVTSGSIAHARQR
jgi:hypothetical protein